jgi:hypothetical protein
MRLYADHLATIPARPFSRAFHHASLDLRTAAASLDDAADNRNQKVMEVAASILRRVYRSMRMLELHWRLEEALVVVAAAYHRKMPLTDAEKLMCSEELNRVRFELSSTDEFTGELLEKGFANQILPNVNMEIRLALAEVVRDHVVINKTTPVAGAYEHLKLACAPF